VTVPRSRCPGFLSLHAGRVAGALARRPMPAGRGGASLRPTDRDRVMLAWATRFGRLNSDQAWRWFYPASATSKAAQNRLCELAADGLLVRVPLRRNQPGLYVPTPAGARASGAGLSAPALSGAAGGHVGHALTVAEVAWWLLQQRARAGAGWLTERELLREAALALPERRAGGRGLLPLVPDGALVLSTGERIAVEVELTDKAGKLDRKLAGYRDRGDYAGVLWLTPGERGRGPLQRAIAAAGCTALMRVEPLPSDLLHWTA
jgi:hypothetical protein